MNLRIGNGTPNPMTLNLNADELSRLVFHVKTDDELRSEVAQQKALEFAYGLRMFMDVARKSPDTPVVVNGDRMTLSEFVGFVVQEQGLQFLTDFRIGSEGTIHVDAKKHTRLDSGCDRVPDRNYLHSVFINTEFKNGEPVFPKHVPYAQRDTTIRVRQKMGRRLKAGCGCGGKSCGC